MNFSMSRAVFLDRDGTINEEVGYLKSLNDLSLISGAAEGISILNSLAYKVIVITNQSGVARGFFSETFLDELHREIEARLLRENALIDRWCYCPHHPTEGIDGYRIACSCRKPAPGMIHKMAIENQIDIASSFVIGDHERDVELAINAGARSILVRTGHGENTLSTMSPEQRDTLSYVAQDLLDACRWISKNYP